MFKVSNLVIVVQFCFKINLEVYNYQFQYFFNIYFSQFWWYFYFLNVRLFFQDDRLYWKVLVSGDDSYFDYVYDQNQKNLGGM